MNKFSELSIPSLVLLTIVMIVIYYNHISEDEIDRISSIDFNNDGMVTKKEMKYYLNLLQQRDKKNKLKRTELIKSSFSGIIRGFIMGFILCDFEGGIVLGLILAVVNPMMTGTENILF